jgi:serine/threonine protein kinase
LQEKHEGAGLAGFAARFELLGRIGAGAHGDVYLARDRTVGRKVVLKALRSLLGTPQEHQAANALARFRREIHILVRFPHPAIVPVYDAQLEHSPPYLVARWMQGGDLIQEISRGAASTSRVAEVGIRLARGLHHLHQQGILHRDVKPGNILLDEEGEAYLSDLGLGIWKEAEGVTKTGNVVGSPRYMAPEIFGDALYSPGSDLFALGATLLELATGEALDGMASFQGITQERIKTIPSIGLRRVLRHCLRSGVKDRPGSGEEVAVVLEELQVACVEDSRSVLLPGSEATLEFSTPEPLAPDVDTRAVSQSHPERVFLGGKQAAFLASLALGSLVVLLWMRGRAAPSVVVSLSPVASSPRLFPEAGSRHLPDIFRGDLASRLEVELDQALGRTYSKRGIPLEGQEGEPFPVAFAHQGVGLLDTFEEQGKILDWIAAGGDIGRLPVWVKEVLRTYDQSLAELGIPETFQPFLDASPRTSPPPKAPPRLAEWFRYRTTRIPVKPESPAAGWIWASHAFLLEAQQQSAAFERDLSFGRVDLSGTGSTPLQQFPSSKHKGRGSVKFQVLSLMNTLPGWEKLRDLTRTGLKPARGFFLAAFRGLDEARGSQAELQATNLAKAIASLDGLLVACFLSATPRRMFGPEARHPTGVFFQAMVLWQLHELRSKTLTLPVSSSRSEMDARFLLRAVEMGLQAGHRKIPLIAFRRYLTILKEQGKAKDLLLRWKQMKPRLGSTWSGLWREKELVDSLLKWARDQVREEAFPP